jgi:hypothetical protein
LRKLPLVRFQILKLRPEVFWLSHINHHIISDGWSWRVFWQDLKTIYEARLRSLPVPAIPARLQYADFAVWQRRVFDEAGAHYRQQIEWWRDRFVDHPPRLRLPFRRLLRKRTAAACEGFIRWGVPADVSARLADFAGAERATYFAIRLAAFAAALAARVRQKDLILGAYVTNRSQVELQQMFGYFANLVTLRLRSPRKQTFRQWVAEVRDVIGQVQAHGDIPYEQLKEELRKEGVALPGIRAIFNLSDSVSTELGDVRVRWADERMARMPWGLTFSVTPRNEHADCRTTFDATRYHPAGVRQLIAGYRHLLDAASRRPDCPVRELLRGG